MKDIILIFMTMVLFYCFIIVILFPSAFERILAAIASRLEKK